MVNNRYFLNNTIENFKESIINKRLVLFGASVLMNEAIEKLILPNNIKIDYIIDNNFYLWYSQSYSIKVKEPYVLTQEKNEDIVVLITHKYPFRAEEQLLSYGISNYYSYLLFIENKIGKYQFLVHM